MFPTLLRNVSLLQISALTCLLALLSACGGRAETTSTEIAMGSMPAARSSSTPSLSPTSLPVTSGIAELGASKATTTLPRRGVLLPGLAGENAYEALQAYVTDDRTAPRDGRSAAMAHPTALDATLDLAATVGQVNTALDAVGARVVAMRPGHKTLGIELATPGDEAAIQAAASRLIASRAFRWVQGPGLPAVPAELTADPAVSEPAENLAPRS